MFEKQNYKEAIERIDSTRAKYRHLPAFHYNLGSCFFADNKFIKAEKAFQKAIKLKPNYMEALKKLSLVYLKLKKNEEHRNIVKKIDEIIAETPQDALENIDTIEVENSLESAIQLHQSGQVENAKKHYLNVLEFQPDNFDALHLLGVLLVQQKDIVSGISYIEKAIAKNPGSSEAVFNLAKAFQNSGNLKSAQKHYKQALSINPQYAQAAFNLGNIMRDLQNMDKAVHYYQTAIRIRPGYSKAHTNLNMALKNIDKSSKTSV